MCSPSAVIVGNPPRYSCTATSRKIGNCTATLSASRRSTDRSSSRSVDLKIGRQIAHVVLHRIRLVAAQHQPALLRPHIDVGVDDARDRLVRPHLRQRRRHHQLVPGRHGLHASIRPAPPPARSQAPAASTTTRARISPRGVRTPATRAAFGDDLLHRRIRQQRGAQPRARPRVAERNLHRFEIEVGCARASPPARRRSRDTASGAGLRRARSARHPGRAPSPLDLLMELRLVFRAARDLEAAGLEEDHRLAGLGLESRRSSATPLAAMRVIVASERSWPLSPAARGELCEASSALSSSATDSPALAR